MALTQTQREQLRIILSQGAASIDYLTQLSSSDSFAVSEIANSLPSLIILYQQKISALTDQISKYQDNLSILQSS